MELLIVAGLAGAGMILNKNKNPSREKREITSPSLANLPSGATIYESRYLDTAAAIDKAAAHKKFTDAWNKQENVITKEHALQPHRDQYVQKMTGADPNTFQRWKDLDTLPRFPMNKFNDPTVPQPTALFSGSQPSDYLPYDEFLNQDDIKKLRNVPIFNINNQSAVKPTAQNPIAKNNTLKEGFTSDIIPVNSLNLDNADFNTTPQNLNNQIVTNRGRMNNTIENPLGKDTMFLSNDPARFGHNNMVPFFRGAAPKQNLDFEANEGVLQRYTGNYDHPTKAKKEIAPMFAPTPNLSNIYGDTAYINDRDMSKYIPSLYRPNEAPTEPVRVGRGLNNGYTATPSGGFHETTRVREYTVDDMRAANKPKETYAGRVVTGKSNVDAPTAKPNVAQYKAPFFLENKNGERNFGGNPVVAAETQRPTIQKAKRVNAKFKGPASGPKANVERANETEKRSFTNKPNERQTTGIRYVINNAVKFVKGLTVYDPEDKPLETKKDLTVVNENDVGYAAPTMKKHTVYDPTDIARTTIKETNIHDGGYSTLAMPKKVTVHDPNDVTRETRKENLLTNRDVGFFTSIGKSTTYDPTDVTRTTVKETTLHDSEKLNVGTQKRHIVYDPTDVSRTTTKETTIDNKYTGGVYRTAVQGTDGYKVTEVKHRYTTRQDIENDPLNEYTGVARGTVEGHRTYDDMYNAETSEGREIVAQGRAPTQNSVKVANGMDTVHIEVHRNDMMDTNKYNVIDEAPQRAVLTNTPLDPSDVKPTETRDKLVVDNLSISERTEDSSLLDAFRANPYTQSLNSSA